MMMTPTLPTSAAEGPAPPGYDIIVMMGQSNAFGCATDPAVPKPYDFSDPRIEVLPVFAKQYPDWGQDVAKGANALVAALKGPFVRDNAYTGHADSQNPTPAKCDPLPNNQIHFGSEGLHEMGLRYYAAYTVAVKAGGGPNPATGQPWSKERAWEWYNARPWINGCNYLPSYAGNSTEFWQDDTFNPALIDKELTLAQSLGYNSVRILMQYLVWENRPESYKRHFSDFLEIAARHGLSVMPQFFDDCAFGLQPDVWKRTNPYIGKQDDPIPGVFFPNWSPSPGHSRVRDRSAWPRLKAYVQDFLKTYQNDPRVLLWDLYNEPMSHGLGAESLPLVQAVFEWAWEVAPSQPLTVGAYGPGELEAVALKLSDIVTFHQYPAPDTNRFKETGRPVICTEWMVRFNGSQVHKDVIANTLPRLKQARMGSYSWGLVKGRSQAQFEWGSQPGTPEPAVPFTDLFKDVDGTPYDAKEIEAIKKVSRDK